MLGDHDHQAALDPASEICVRGSLERRKQTNHHHRRENQLAAMENPRIIETAVDSPFCPFDLDMCMTK